MDARPRPTRPMNRSLARAAALACLALLAAAPARAQMVAAPAVMAPALLLTTTPFAQVHPFATPPEPDRPPVALAPLAPTPAATPAPTPAAAPAEVLRHLPNNIQGFRFAGEIAASEWPVFLSPAQARSRLRFRVGYLSAVSVMPEASTLTVSVNDQPIGSIHIDAPNKVAAVEFDVPAHLVKPGFNAVRIAVEQRHRVDCSVEATYELWTQIDPSQTGLLLPATVAFARDRDEIAALPPDAQGKLPVRLVLPGRVSPANIERAIRAVQLIAAAGRFEQPQVDVGPMAGGDYGVNLVVGRYSEVATIADLSELGAVEGPRLAILPATASRRATLIVTGASEDDVNHALDSFTQSGTPSGTPAGLRAANSFPGYRINGGEEVRLGDLGLNSEEFSGRYFRAAFNLVMPADFYSADYAKVELDLAGGYAAGLLSTAKLIVAVNGRNVVSAALQRSSGDLFKQNTLPLPLGFFRPGLNRVEIQAQLPNAADAACDPLNALSPAKRFLFLDSTRIRIPRLARIARMPDLAVTATGGFPFIGGDKQPKLFMPAPDRNLIGAAATLAGRIAASAGRPIDFRFVTKPPPVGSGATLVVASAAQLDPQVARVVGLDREELLKSWSDRLSAPPTQADENLSDYDRRVRNRLVLQKNLPAACHLRRPPQPTKSIALADMISPPATGATIPTEPAPERDLYAEWAQAYADQARWRKWGAAAANAVGAALRDAFDWTASKARRFGAARGGAPASPYDPGRSLLIAQAPLGSEADDVWTVITAPNSALLAQSVDCLSDPRVWRHVDGRLAMLDDSNGEIATLPADQTRFVATQPLTFGNIHLIAASWLSLNANIYVAMVLAVAALLAFATLQFVGHVGRRDE